VNDRAPIDDGQTDLDVDDLIDALGARLRWANAHPDLRDYWSQRYDVLCTALGLDTDVIDGRTGWDDDLVRRVLRDAAESTLTPPNPFGGILEGGAVLLPIYRAVSSDLDDLAERHVAVNRRIARGCLLLLSPELERRTCSLQVLRDAGLEPTPPDPGLYW